MILPTSRIKRSLLTVLFSVALPFASFAQVVWDGGGGTSFWNTATNWSTDATPTNGAAVQFINSGGENGGIIELEDLTASGASADTQAVSILVGAAMTNGLTFNLGANALNSNTSL